MEDYRDFIMTDRTFDLENTISENLMLKKKNNILIAISLLIGVAAIGFTIFLIDQENQKKAST
jgi:hypothetical protein